MIGLLFYGLLYGIILFFRLFFFFCVDCGVFKLMMIFVFVIDILLIGIVVGLVLFKMVSIIFVVIFFCFE